MPKIPNQPPAISGLGFDSDFGFRISDLATILVALLSISVVAQSSCFAQAAPALPLEGWYRTGRYMPVRLNRGQSKITASGAVSTDRDAIETTPTIVPVLIFTSNVSDLRIDGSPPNGAASLRPLSSRQQLVAVAGSGDRLAAKLFPGESIVTVHVDPLDPLPGPELAWQTLDALILDAPWPGSFDPHKIPNLLAGGTEIAVRSLDRPDNTLPWEAIDGGWVLRPFIAGPIGCDGNLEAYSPVSGWHPDLPESTRLQTVVVAVLFSIAILACLLLPATWRLTAMGIATAAAALAVDGWRTHSPALFTGTGSVIIHSAPVLQSDHWEFIAARNAATGTCDFTTETWPIFADPSQALASNISLQWKGTAGQLKFDLPPDGKLAFVSRTLQPPSASATTTPTIGQPVLTETPMTAIARALYLHPHDQETTEAGDPWDATAPAPSWPTAHAWP
jgi:hypothetical protein